MAFNALRAQYARNLAGLESMLAKALKTGRKVGGYTADELAAGVADFRALSVADDDSLAAHLNRMNLRIAERLQELHNAS